MAILQKLNSKSNLRKTSNADLPSSPQFPVAARYEATSTAAQTIINMSFSVDQSNTDAFEISVDGKELRPGASNDYTFTSIQSDNTSSQVTLNSSIAVNLNIIAKKFGTKKESEFNMDNRFVALYEAEGQAFQGFVKTSSLITATSTTGTPVAGTFHSVITNRASIVDPTQDLRPRFGIDRLTIQQIYQLQTEFGSSGELIWAAVNDDRNLIRFVGNWSQTTGTSGNVISASISGTDYLEVTFYGTGLDMMIVPSATAITVTSQIDGATATALLTAQTYSAILAARNYAPNQVVNVVAGLTLGVHTVRLNSTGVSLGLTIQGFEILNQNVTPANISVNPGISYASGQKITTAAQQLFLYNTNFESGTLGTKGGRVAIYQKSDGTVAKAVTPTNASQLNLTSADHTNEEVQRTYHYREFGAGRADDFSLFNSTTATSLAFTLDDGTATLVGFGVGVFTATPPALYPATAAGNFISFTFVGTGLDFIRQDTTNSTGTDSFTYSINGTVINTIASGSTGSTIRRKEKVVSGLPYGTHVFRIQRTAAANAWDVGVQQFIVYQPKTPTIPTGSNLVGSYNIAANFVANGTAGLDTVSTGILRKHITREHTLFGGSFSFANPTAGGANTYVGGNEIFNNTVGHYDELVFFGTGFELRGYGTGASSATVTVALQNLTSGGSLLTLSSANFAGLATSSYGAFAFTYATGNLAENVTPAVGSGMSVSGLPLASYRVRFTNGAAAFMEHSTIDIITPIHSPRSNVNYDQQNTLPVGSQAISDDRKLTPIKDVNLQKKNVSQAFGFTSNPTTTSTVAVPLPDMSVVHTNTSGRIKVSYSADIYNNTAVQSVITVIYVDNVQVGKIKFSVANQDTPTNDVIVIPVSPGVHKIDIYWYNSGAATATARNDFRNMLVEEI